MNSERAEQVIVELGTRSYPVLIAPDLLADENAQGMPVLVKHLSGRRAMLVTDSHLAPLYGERILSQMRTAGAEHPVMHVFEAGEESKTFQTVESMCRAAARAGLDRDSIFVALGGGVAGDMTGFAASIYMRGVGFLQIPASLLAMIDASVGGKTGADLPEGKNLIGTFWQPRAVLMDVSFLRTLPADQLRSGCAELIKHAILFDPDLFALLEDSISAILELSDPAMAARQIARSCRIKAAVVAGDERESGRRALLNLGHSFGHALEKLSGYTFSHGDAVSAGTAIASTLSVSLRRMKEPDSVRIHNLLRKTGLPVRVSGYDPHKVLEAMRGDKKNLHGALRIVLPLGIGRAEVVEGLPEDAILAAIGAHCD